MMMALIKNKLMHIKSTTNWKLHANIKSKTMSDDEVPTKKRKFSHDAAAGEEKEEEIKDAAAADVVAEKVDGGGNSSSPEEPPPPSEETAVETPTDAATVEPIVADDD